MDAAKQQRALQGLVFGAIGAAIPFALCPTEENVLGWCGEALADALAQAFGWGAWLQPLLFGALAYGCFHAQGWSRARAVWTLKLFAAQLFVCTLLHLAHGPGGRLGALVGGSLVAAFGLGAYVAAAIAVALLCMRWAGSVRSVSELAWNGQQRLAAAWRAGSARELAVHSQRRAQLTATRGAAAVVRAQQYDDAIEVELVEETIPNEALVARAVSVKPSVAPPPLPQTAADVLVSEPTVAEASTVEPADESDHEEEYSATGLPAPLEPVSKPALPYQLPSSALLAPAPTCSREVDERALKATALQLEERLAGFGILGRVDGLTPGPVVTTFEFEPKVGTKLSKITALSRELSMALMSGVRVRIIAPLPNTGRVGIEVPHAESDRDVVALRSLVEDARWHEFDAALPLALGVETSGQPVYCDLVKLQHLLVAGATGAGKSVGLNAMLAAILMKNTPDDVRLLMIDPKVVELAAFDGIPHLLVPVITELPEAISALRWAVSEMERRYQLFAEVGARNLGAYNAREGVSPLPRIVVVVDEFGDLMLADDKQKRVEASLARLAQKARAAGMHIVLATQYPTTDVITGLIKANLSRIAFRVASSTESQVILGPGVTAAKTLTGRGDMLCQLPGAGELLRVHGAYVGDDELKTFCDFLRAQGAPEYDDTILAATASVPDAVDGDQLDDDPFYARAVGFVKAEGSCSISAVQRKLSVGYNRAAKLVERMERDGFVGPAARGGGKREVLLATPG
jgi:DNA segregation ATPase FtsK/SpoIIIE, S-DNA-T family